MNNKIVGYGVVDHWEDHEHLISIAVDQNNRRKGIGERILTELEKRSSKEKTLKLEVRQSNVAAIQLYSKRGFTKTAVAEGYYGDGEDAIIMEKRLVREALVKG